MDEEVVSNRMNTEHIWVVIEEREQTVRMFRWVGWGGLGLGLGHMCGIEIRVDTYW